MAFERGNRAPQENNDEWKATGFLNLSLPKKNADGSIGSYKLGRTGIPLRANVPGEKKLLDMIAKDKDAAIKLILEHLRVEYRAATPGEAPDFAF